MVNLFLHGPVTPEVYRKIYSSSQDENLHAVQLKKILQRNLEQKVRKQRQININFHRAPLCLFPHIRSLCIPSIHFILVKTLVKTENQRFCSFIFVPALHDTDPLNFPISRFKKERIKSC